MIEIETLKTDILELSPEAQEMVAKFVSFLKYQSTSTVPQPRSLDLGNSTFVGMWSDRPEAQNSSQWVRAIRQNEWNQ